MDIRQLETFIEVIDCSNFSKAADNLFLTQPTVSAHINSLEKELNTQLIKRTTKEFQVTEAGEKLYTYAMNIISIKKKIIEDLIGVRNQSLKVGASSAISLGDLPNLLQSFHYLFPEVKFEIDNSDSLEIISDIYDGSLEIGFVGTKVEKEGLNFTVFDRDELVVVAPNSLYYQKYGNTFPLEKLNREAFIMREEKSGTKKEMERILSKVNLDIKDLNIVASMNNPVSILECIKNGLGISILSKKTTKIYENDKRFRFFPIENVDTSRDLYIVTAQEKYLSELVKAFVTHIKKNYMLE